MFWGESPKMKELRKIVQKVARTDASILITGENGTGKDMLAGEIHRLSKRSGSSIRARARGLHRRQGRPGGQVRGGLGRHPLSRRDRQHPPAPADQAAHRHPDQERHPRGQQRPRPRGYPPDLRHEPGHLPDGRRRSVPRGPVFQDQYHTPHPSAPARADGGHRPVSGALHAQVRGQIRQGHPGHPGNCSMWSRRL